MTVKRSARAVRRIVVALDASAQSRAALETAAQVAAWHEAELHGVYVEDINLIRLAALPTTREVGPVSPTPRPLAARAVERTLQRAAATAERTLAEAAGHRRVRWAFTVARGTVTAVLLEAAAKADVIALGRAGAGTLGPGRLGSTARAITARREQSVLLLQEALAPGRPIAVIVDGSACGDRALAAAVELSERVGVDLVVLIAAADAARARALRTTTAARLEGLAPGRRVRMVVGADVDTVARAVRAERPALCVVGCRGAGRDALVNRLTDDLRASVYLVK